MNTNVLLYEKRCVTRRKSKFKEIAREQNKKHIFIPKKNVSL